jgi:hypothetical protein
LAAARRWFSRSAELGRSLGDQRFVAYLLEAWAGVASADGDVARAARLLGSAEALRKAGGFPRSPAEVAAHAALTTGVRGALGEAGFAAAWAEGQVAPS